MLYPEYDDILKVSMVKEANLFFSEVLSKDLSLTNFAASDFSGQTVSVDAAYVCTRLADVVASDELGKYIL